MDYSDIIRNQFDRQAQNFRDWSVTQNREYHQGYFDFCMINPSDVLLDVACGSGDFVHFCASEIERAAGVDISERMIDLAKQKAIEEGRTNVEFTCHNVEHLPCPSEAFSIVTCKSAFHHVHAYDRVFSEMRRCCQTGGRISIQDIVAYDQEAVDDFFESMERLIDISHHKALPKQFYLDLYKRFDVTLKNTFELEVELHFRDYLDHARQPEEDKEQIEVLLQNGLSDNRIEKYFVVKNGELYFKRNVFIILGVK
jgi:ubiquinone/menaquinone biosynthesis C-methylase UbiE